MPRQTVGAIGSSPRFAFLLALFAAASCGGSSGSSAAGAGGGPPPALDSDGDGIADQDETALGTDPFGTDSDFDSLSDGFEVDLGTNPLAADLVTFLTGRALTSNGAAAQGAALELRHAALDHGYAGLSASADASGEYSFAAPWPTAVHLGASVSARLASGGLSTAQLALPQLTPGLFVLPELVLEPVPLTRGTEFFVALPFLDDLFFTTQIAAMAIMNPGDSAAHVTWVIPGTSFPGNQGVLTVPAHDARAIGLPAAELILEPAVNAGIETVPRGVRLRSTEPVVVAIQTYDGGNDGMAVFAAQPLTSYGTEYYVRAFQGTGYWDRGSYAMVTAGVDDCTLQMTITTPMTLVVDGQEVFIPTGVPTTTTIDLEDSLQLVTSYEDLTGSLLRSDSPFGVCSGTTSLSYDELRNSTTASVLLESLPPTDQWGTDFVSLGSIGSVSAVYIVAGPQGAAVTVGSAPAQHLLPGEDLKVELENNNARAIHSDEPILVWQVFGWAGGGAGAVNLTPPERWSRDEVVWVFSATDLESGLAVLAPTTSLDQVLLDGTPIVDLPETDPPGTVNATYSYVITPVTGGLHRITSPEPVFPVAFGSTDLAGTAGFMGYAYSTVW